MRKIKVLRIVARLNIGGPAIHTILLTEGLDRERFETILVSGREEGSEGNMLYLTQAKNIDPLVIPELGRALNIRNDIIAFWKIFRLIKKERPDIIHTHTAKAGALGRLAALLYRVSLPAVWGKPRPKVVHTFHGHVLHSYFSRIKSICFIWIERFLALFTDTIIAVSENLKQELLVLRIAAPEKIKTIALGLELEQFLEIEDNGLIQKEHRSIGIIGRLVPVKNHKMFLEAARKVKDALGLVQKVKFIIIGDGPLRQELQGYSRGLGLADDVTFAGWVKDLKNIYTQLDVVALSSLNEGTPVALIEAQAAARPCVATSVGGVADVIQEGRSGLLVSSNDPQGLADNLIRLVNDPQLRQTMGQYGREQVRERFSKSRLIKDIESLYQEQLT